MLVRAILEAEGYTIVDAEDGLAGIEAAIREEPALILLDVNLPGIDGYEVVAILKSFPDLATTPVIALTAYAMEGDRQRTPGGRLRRLHPEADRRRHLSPPGRGVPARQARAGRGARGGRLPPRAEPAAGLPAASTRSRSSSGSTSTSCAAPPSSADLHRAVQDITSEVGVRAMLEQLLPALSRALGTRSLSVELPELGRQGGGGRRQRRAAAQRAGRHRARHRRGLDRGGLDAAARGARPARSGV